MVSWSLLASLENELWGIWDTYNLVWVSKGIE